MLLRHRHVRHTGIPISDTHHGNACDAREWRQCRTPMERRKLFRRCGTTLCGVLRHNIHTRRQGQDGELAQRPEHVINCSIKHYFENL